MSLRIIKAGLLDTIQDSGRWGYQYLGINVNGAMDLYSAQMANALLGKNLHDPVIEMHFPAPVIQFSSDTIICLTGGDFFPCIDDSPIPLHQPVVVKSGSILRYKKLMSGARTYLAVLNGFNLTTWLQSHSTNLNALTGGFNGRALQAGDVLYFLKNIDLRKILQHNTAIPLHWKAEGNNTAITHLQIIQGSEWGWLTADAQDILLHDQFAISPTSNRMGIRLSGKVLEQQEKKSLLSSAVTNGTIQLLPNGQLIILAADHQTTGGYPRVGAVISAHLPYLAQRQPKEFIRFSLTSLEKAESLLTEQQVFLQNLQNACTFKMEKLLYAH